MEKKGANAESVPYGKRQRGKQEKREQCMW